MIKIKQLITFAFLIMPFMSFAQTSTTKLEEQTYIEVIGTAEKEVIPDEIYIEIIIRERYVNKVKMTIEDQEVKLMNAIKSLGIDLKNLYLSDANSDYVKIRWNKNDVLTKKDYTLMVPNASTVGQVFLELEKLEIKDAYISKVNHSKIDSLKKEIKIMAIKAAKDKADYLLMAIGEKTGKPLIVTENTQTIIRQEIIKLPTRNINSLVATSAGITQEDYSRNEIQFEKIKLTSDIYVKFSIK
jgi:uncharacterized protein YggE